MSLFIYNLQEHITLIANLHSLNDSILRCGKLASNVLENGGKILFCGNGGSAADSQHLAAELTGRFINDRPPLAAIALSTDTSALTCIGNDYSFDEIFSRQVQALGRVGDILICISTSGNSINIIRAAEQAKKLGLTTIGLLGRDGGALCDICDISIVVPSSVTARIQECHILIGHTLCGLIEQELGIS
jgi:D-sedoheptulose 7-phosphate isomerase